MWFQLWCCWTFDISKRCRAFKNKKVCEIRSADYLASELSFQSSAEFRTVNCVPSRTDVPLAWLATLSTVLSTYVEVSFCNIVATDKMIDDWWLTIDDWWLTCVEMQCWGNELTLNTMIVIKTSLNFLQLLVKFNSVKAVRRPIAVLFATRATSSTLTTPALVRPTDCNCTNLTTARRSKLAEDHSMSSRLNMASGELKFYVRPFHSSSCARPVRHPKLPGLFSCQSMHLLLFELQPQHGLQLLRRFVRMFARRTKSMVSSSTLVTSSSMQRPELLVLHVARCVFRVQARIRSRWTKPMQEWVYVFFLHFANEVLMFKLLILIRFDVVLQYSVGSRTAGNASKPTSARTATRVTCSPHLSISAPVGRTKRRLNECHECVILTGRLLNTSM